MRHEQRQCPSCYCIPGALALCPAHRRHLPNKAELEQMAQPSNPIARMEESSSMGWAGEEGGQVRLGQPGQCLPLFSVAATT